MEPRTVVHTKRCYGNFPVSLVKHAQENCQKIQDLKECKFECCVKCKVYRVYKLECIKMFFHSKSGWERQWSVSVWAVFQLSPTAREFYVLPDQKDATPRTISPSSLYRCICKRGKRVALQTSQACIVIHWQVDPFRVRFFFFFFDSESRRPFITSSKTARWTQLSVRQDWRRISAFGQRSMETSLPVAAQVSPVETKRLKKIQRGEHVVSRISSIHSGHIELAIPLFKVSVVPI